MVRLYVGVEVEVEVEVNVNGDLCVVMMVRWMERREERDERDNWRVARDGAIEMREFVGFVVYAMRVRFQGVGRCSFGSVNDL